MLVKGAFILGELNEDYLEILTPEAQSFLVNIHRCFEDCRQQLLRARIKRQLDFDEGILPEFIPETRNVREDLVWRGAPPGPGLQDRRVEITGPVDRKMVINALNSDATQYMADFEDSTSPTWTNIMNGQVNLRDANRRNISFNAPNGKVYQLKDGNLPVLIVRPRGWHLDEMHFLVDGKPISASLFDFGLYFFHNARETIKNVHGPYFYLPKMESHLEARLWNDVFNLSQDMLNIPRGTIRATVLIETITAAFEMDEIIYELREHSAGLNCGRWDYIFSLIKKMHNNPKFVLPDRSSVTMAAPFMQAYVDLLIKTCHKRGVHAMGGMAAQIPIKNDAAANEAAMNRVKADKEREVLSGHDGTWVAHPDLVHVAKTIFDKHMPQPNQLFLKRSEVKIIGSDLLNTNVEGVISKNGVQSNVNAALLYIDNWLEGNGCVPINHLMEDAATAEIARSQLWQWVHYNIFTDDTRELIDKNMINGFVQDAKKKYKISQKAVNYLLDIVFSDEFADFITTECYKEIVVTTANSKI